MLARRAGLNAKDFTGRCQLSLVKIAEFQRRAVVHFHALIQLNGPGADLIPARVNLDAADLAHAIREAAGLPSTRHIPPRRSTNPG